MTRLPYSSSFEKRMKDLDLHLQNYYIVCFQLSSDKKDISLLKEIIITEKKNAYCYRYDDLIITIYFLETVTDSVPKYILSNCHEIIDIAYTRFVRNYSRNQQMSYYPIIIRSRCFRGNLFSTLSVLF